MTTSSNALTIDQIGRLLARAYPQSVCNFDGKDLHWRDGSTLTLADKQTELLENVDTTPSPLLAQFAVKYPLGPRHNISPPQLYDPGRTRDISFLKKMYGETKAEVEARLVQISWMPRSRNKSILITSTNGVDRQLIKVSAELDQLPRSLRKYVTKIGGTYNWRNIGESDQLSPHAFGIAIDINVAYGDYWLWDVKRVGKAAFRNRIPHEIVEIFERHGFIWGGKWQHYDTMHFEYRPELIMASDENYGKRKVLYLSREPTSYGAERQLSYLAEGLTEDRYIPFILYSRPESDSKDILKRANTASSQMRMRPWKKTANLFTRYLDAMRLLNVARREKVDLIHCSYQWLLPYALFLSRRMRVPLVAHIRRPNNSPEKLAGLGCKECDAVIAISTRIKRELLLLDNLYGKIHLIPDAVDLPSFNDSYEKPLRRELDIHGEVLFGLVARIYKNKRQLDYVKAAKQLLDLGYNAQFVLVGRIDDKQYFQQIENFIVSNQLTEKVHILGHRDDIVDVLSSLDVLVSLAGGSVMYEAMAIGRTVISAGFTHPENATHLINEFTGLVTESRELGDLVSIMERTLKNPELRSTLGQSAQAWAQSNFSIDSMVAKTQQIYDDLLR